MEKVGALHSSLFARLDSQIILIPPVKVRCLCLEFEQYHYFSIAHMRGLSSTHVCQR